MIDGRFYTRHRRPVIPDQIGQVRHQFIERHVFRLSDMSERTGELVRATHVENEEAGIPLETRGQRHRLNPRRWRRRAPEPAGQQFHRRDPFMLLVRCASRMLAG
jgi:hypothetical protein